MYSGETPIKNCAYVALKSSYYYHYDKGFVVNEKGFKDKQSRTQMFPMVFLRCTKPIKDYENLQETFAQDYTELYR
jgi:hypothetical protein